MRFCALLPQLESFNKENGHYNPPGFNLIFLPFSEDSRNIESVLASPTPIPKPEKSDLRTAKLFIKNMTIEFDSHNFENPTIQKFYSGLQSLALGEEIEPIQDTLEPDYEGMSKMKDVINKMKHEFSLGTVQKETKVKAPDRKRKKPEDDKEKREDEPPVKSKRMKKEETEEKKEVKMDDTKLKEMCDEGELMQLTNGRLKELCEQRGMKIGRETKRDMVKKLQDYIDKVKK